MSMTMREIMEELRAGGFTEWLIPEQTNGYLVGGAVQGSKFNSVDDVTARDVVELLIRAEGHADTIGGWIDRKDEGRTHLDGNDWYPLLDTALEVARERGERAVWDIAAQEDIYVS